MVRDASLFPGHPGPPMISSLKYLLVPLSLCALPLVDAGFHFSPEFSRADSFQGPRAISPVSDRVTAESPAASAPGILRRVKIVGSTGEGPALRVEEAVAEGG